MPRFHIGKLRIGDWIDGMHLERIFQHNENGEISVEDAATKAADFIGTVLEQWVLYKPLFISIVSNEGVDSANRIEVFLQDLEVKLNDIALLTDIPEAVEDYKFSDNEEWNAFYHQLLGMIASASADAKYSALEFATIITFIANFIKTH